jgi:hypothetical protein
LAIGPLACDGTPDPPPDEPDSPSLVELDAWERVAEVDEDVFGAERPAGAVCDEVLGIGTELLGSELVLEINTDFCDYATVRQPSLRALVPGDIVAIRTWHYPLTAPAPAQAHLALAIDGEIAWEQLVPSPAEEAFVDGELALDRDLPAGTELQFHVHNHGANSYDLLAIEIVRDDADRSVPQ